MVMTGRDRGEEKGIGTARNVVEETCWDADDRVCVTGCEEEIWQCPALFGMLRRWQ